MKNHLVALCQAEGIVLGNSRNARAFKGMAAGVLALASAGCAANGNTGPAALSGGENCQSIRSNLNRLDNQGVPALVERQNSGKKLSPAQKAQADLYNRLLDQYLGARCHV